VNSDSNLTPIKLDVWIKREIVINIKVASNNNNSNNNRPRSNLATNYKTKTTNKKNKERRETNTPRFGNSVQSNNDLYMSGGEISFHLTKVSKDKVSITNLISTIFPNIFP